MLITASTDFCCKLWSLDGNLIGIFGQDAHWNLKAHEFESSMSLLIGENIRKRITHILTAMLDEIRAEEKRAVDKLLEKSALVLPPINLSKQTEFVPHRSQIKSIQVRHYKISSLF